MKVKQEGKGKSESETGSKDRRKQIWQGNSLLKRTLAQVDEDKKFNLPQTVEDEKIIYQSIWPCDYV